VRLRGGGRGGGGRGRGRGGVGEDEVDGHRIAIDEGRSFHTEIESEK